MQAYRGSYSSVTSSGSIRYELGVMRFPCNESHVMSDQVMGEKQIIFATDCSCSGSKMCSCERRILGDMCNISSGQESIKTVETAPVFV